MSKTAILLAGLLAFASAPAFAQVVVSSRPVVTYYTPTYYTPAATLPAPVVTYYSPGYSTYSSSRVVYDAPITVSRPVTTYYAPIAEAVPVTSYYAPTYTVQPTTTFYTPVTTYYGGTVVKPVYGSPVVAGRSAYGTLRAYVPGQPVRNTLRFALP